MKWIYSCEPGSCVWRYGPVGWLASRAVWRQIEWTVAVIVIYWNY